MFLYSIYKSPFWQNLSQNARMLRVTVAGLILYIIICSYLYSKFGEKDLIVNYRRYVFYLMGVDIAVTFAEHYVVGTKPKKIKKKKDKGRLLIRPKNYPFVPQIPLNNPPMRQRQQQPPQQNLAPLEDVSIQVYNSDQLIDMKDDTSLPVYQHQDETSLPLYDPKPTEPVEEDIPVYQN